jgi:hypothetical protein
MKKYIYNENAKKIKLLFIDIIESNKTKRRKLQTNKQKTRKR